MSEHFYSEPNKIRLQLTGSDDNIYLYDYLYQDGNWVYQGAYTSNGQYDNSDSKKPKIWYNIIDGEITSSINNCSPTDLDFPVLNLEFDSFYTVGVPVGYQDNCINNNDHYFQNYNKSICNSKMYEPDDYYIARCNYQYGYGYYEDYKYTGEASVNKGGSDVCSLCTGIGTGIQITYNTGGDSNTDVYLPVDDVSYSKLYKMDPHIYYNKDIWAKDYTIYKDSLEEYYRFTTLVYGCYANWKSYLYNISSSIGIWQNKTDPLDKKYTHISINNNTKEISTNDDNEKMVLESLFGLKDNTDYYYNNSLIVYNAKIKTNEPGYEDNIEKTVTNLDIYFQDKKLQDFDVGPNDDKQFLIKKKNNFQKVINRFTGSYINDKLISTKGNEIIEILDAYTGNLQDRISIDQFYDDILGYNTYVASGAKSFYIKTLHNIFSLIDTQTSCPYDLSKGFHTISDNYIFNNSVDGHIYRTNRIDVDVDFYIISRQLNTDPNEEGGLIYKYYVQYINKKLPLYIKGNEYYDIEKSETQTGYYYRSFIDYPLVNRLSADTNPEWSSLYDSGSANTVLRDDEHKNKFYAGTMYSILEKSIEKYGSDEVSYTYYNNALNKKSICSCQGSTCTDLSDWRDI